jgi:hypothetical protein
MYAQAETLLDVEWQLGLLRKPNKKLVDEQDFELADPAVLRRRLKKYETRVLNAGGVTCAPKELLVAVERVRDRLRLREWEEYEARLADWRALTPGACVRTPRKSLTRTERILRQGKSRGRTAGFTWDGSDKPKRPPWLREMQDNDRAQERRDSRSGRALPNLTTQTWHEKEVERVHAVLARRARAKQARKRSHLEALQVNLLDWAWGVGRCGGLLVDGWLYFDCADVPYESLRQHVLEAVAVRCTTGWAFPPETARGRVVVAGAAAGTGAV